MKVEKDGVIKAVESERDLGDYLDAGWKLYEEKAKVEIPKEKHEPFFISKDK